MDENNKVVQAYLDSLLIEYHLKIEKFARNMQARFVIPWLVANGYTFAAGMGTWGVFDQNNNRVDPRHIQPDVLNILAAEADGQGLGSWMSDYPKTRKI